MTIALSVLILFAIIIAAVGLFIVWPSDTREASDRKALAKLVRPRTPIRCRLFGHRMRLIQTERGIAGPSRCIRKRCTYRTASVRWPRAERQPAPRQTVRSIQERRFTS